MTEEELGRLMAKDAVGIAARHKRRDKSNMQEYPNHCQNCGDRLPQSARRLYCDEACRMAMSGKKRLSRVGAGRGGWA